MISAVLVGHRGGPWHHDLGLERNCSAGVGVRAERAGCSIVRAVRGMLWGCRGRPAVPLRARYHAVTAEGFAACPPGPPPRLRNRGGWFHRDRDAWNLATRFQVEADQILRLLNDTRIPALTGPTRLRPRLLPGLYRTGGFVDRVPPSGDTDNGSSDISASLSA